MNGPKVESIAAPHTGNGMVRIRLYAGKPEYPTLLRLDKVTERR